MTEPSESDNAEAPVVKPSPRVPMARTRAFAGCEGYVEFIKSEQKQCYIALNKTNKDLRSPECRLVRHQVCGILKGLNQNLDKADQHWITFGESVDGLVVYQELTLT